MYGTITEDQVRGANLTFEHFRETVNYEYGKNKGYVRLTHGPDNSLVLEKYNNKLDVDLSLRHNLSPDACRALRDKLVGALTGRMRGAAADAVAEIRQMLLGPNAHSEIATKPLSRREIRNAFAKYDQVMNTPEARKSCARWVLHDAYETARTAFERKYPDRAFMPQKDFLGKYMGLAKGIDSPVFSRMFDLEDLNVPLYDANDPNVQKLARKGKIDINRTKLQEWEAKESEKAEVAPDAHDVHGAKRVRPMEVSDVLFHRALGEIYGQVQQALALIESESMIAQSIERAMAATEPVKTDPNDPFAGSGLTARMKAQIRGGLEALLRQRGIDVGMGAGEDTLGDVKVFDMFMDRVLPAMYRAARQQAETVRESGERVESSSFLTVDTIIDAAQEFLVQYDELRRGIADAGSGKSGKDKDDAVVEYMVNWCKKTGEDLKSTAFFMTIRETIVYNTGMKKADWEKTNIFGMLLKDYASAKDVERLEAFTRAFVEKKFPTVSADFDKPPATQAAIAEKRLKHATLAAKLNYGERWVSEVTGRLTQDKGAADFLAKMNDLVVKLVNYYCDGDIDEMVEMCNTLGEARVAKIMNEKIRHAIENDPATTRLNTAPDDANDQLFGLQGAAQLYLRFTQKATARMTKAYNEYKAKLASEVKKGAISAEQAGVLLHNVFAAAQRSLMRDARAQFLRDLPTGRVPIDGIKEFVDENKGKIDAIVKRTITEATSVADEQLTLVKLSETRMSFEARKSIREAMYVPTFVGKCNDLLLANRLEPAFRRLYFGIAGEQLKALKKSAGYLDRTASEKLLSEVNSEFEKRATALYENVRTLREESRRFVRKSVKDTLWCELNLSSKDVDPFWAPYAKHLKKDEKKALADLIASETVSRLEDDIDELFDRVVRNPLGYRKLGDVKGMIEDLLMKTTGSNSVQGQIDAVLRERKEAVDRMMNPKGDKDVAKAKREFVMERRGAALAQVMKTLGVDEKDEAMMAGVRALVDKHAAVIVERVNNLPVHYASVKSAEDLKAKIAGELAAELVKPLGKFTEAWKGFLSHKLTKKTMTAYAGMGEEAVKSALTTTAMLIVGSVSGRNFKPDAMAKLFVGVMDKSLKDKYAQISTDVDAYLEKIDKALAGVEEAEKLYRDGFLAWAAKVKAPEEVIRHFNEKIMPRFTERMYTEACVNPDSFDRGEYSRQYDMGDYAGFLTADLDKVDVAGTGNVRAMMKNAGVAKIAKFKVDGKFQEIPEEAVARMEKNVSALLKLPRIASRRAELMIAQMEQSFQTYVEKIEYGKTTPRVRETLDGFNKEITDICNPVIGEINLENFCKTDFNEAIIQFNAWLDGYNETYPLPTNLYNEKTLRDMAIDLFRGRFDEIHPKLLANDVLKPEESRTINAKFLRDLSGLFAREGVEMVINQTIATKFEEKVAYFDKIALRDFGFRCYTISDELKKHEKDPAYAPLFTVIARNRDLLYRQISANMMTARDQILMEVTSYEDMARNFDTRVMSKINAYLNINVNGLAFASSDRVEMVMTAIKGAKVQRENLVGYLDRIRILIASDMAGEVFSEKIQAGAEAFVAGFKKLAEQMIRQETDRFIGFAMERGGLTGRGERDKAAERFLKGNLILECEEMLIKSGKKKFGPEAKELLAWLKDFRKALATEEGKAALDRVDSTTGIMLNL